MSYESEHRRMKPVLEKAQKLDIAHHPAPNSIFDPLLAGFNIWCTPDDHPQGWERLETQMIAGAFSKPCEYVAAATWGWEGERITHVRLTTDAYALHDREGGSYKPFRNRPEDIEWATAKVLWLFALADVECPPIHIGDEE